MNEGAVQLRKKLAGRVEMCLNTAKLHPDPHVRDEMRIRATCYMNAEQDAKDDDEVNALITLWQAVEGVNDNHGLQGPQFKEVRRALEELNKIWKRET